LLFFAALLLGPLDAFLGEVDEGPTVFEFEPRPGGYEFLEKGVSEGGGVRGRRDGGAFAAAQKKVNRNVERISEFN